MPPSPLPGDARSPGVPLGRDHDDYGMLAPVVSTLLEQAGGLAAFALDVPLLIRKAIDEIIDTARTNRFTLSETEKTEKTYLGTKIEILFRAHLRLQKGRNLDLSVRGAEVDIKNTMGGNWAIPLEAVGHPCIIIKENEKTAICSVGLIVAHQRYLSLGQNRDSKRTISQLGLQNVWWILKDFPYPPNLWEQMTTKKREAIMGAGGGTQRVATLFTEIQQTAVSRSTVEDVAQQKDAMKRIRRNGGARDILAPQGIAVLWGQKDRVLLEKLGLPAIAPDEFISYKPTNPEHEALLRAADHID